MAQTLSIPAQELVRQTVQNEVNANGNAKYMFRDRKETQRGSQTRLMVETKDSMVGLVMAYDDHPLTPEQRKNEQARVGRFLKNPDELKRKQKQERDDAERITKIVRALADAFLYEYDGTEPGRPGVGKVGHELVRLTFRPNPDYDPPSRVEQVLTAMHGHMLIDNNEHRIALIDGTLMKEVSFGWGILGHLDRGGRFLVEQGDVDNGHCEITRMSLAFTGKILIFKSLNIKSDEVYSHFHRVPPDLTFAQGLELLQKQEAALAENHPQR